VAGALHRLPAARGIVTNFRFMVRVTNLKSEIRNPKEIRSPKSESGWIDAMEFRILGWTRGLESDLFGLCLVFPELDPQWLQFAAHRAVKRRQSGAAAHAPQGLADFVWASQHAKRLGVRALLRRFPLSKHAGSSVLIRDWTIRLWFCLRQVRISAFFRPSDFRLRISASST
jgi:hypothetical protein